MMNRYRRHTAPADRLKRVQDIERFQASQADVTATYNSDSNLLLIHDPIATLVWCDKRIWLAVGEVNGIQYDGEAMESLGHNLLAESAAKISVQLSSPAFRSLDVSGKAIEALDPTVATRESRSFYLLQTPFLIATTALLLSRLSLLELKSLPKVATTNEFPYRERSGESEFRSCSFMQSDIASANTAECSQCIPAVKLDLSQGQRVLEHVGCHVLFDPLATESTEEPCGLCLRSPDRCKWFVAKGRGSKANLRVDNERSASPCSNVPLRCPLCSKAEPAVWRYNLRRHLITSHPTCSPADYASLWTISASEMAAMKKRSSLCLKPTLHWPSQQPSRRATPGIDSLISTRKEALTSTSQTRFCPGTMSHSLKRALRAAVHRVWTRRWAQWSVLTRIGGLSRGPRGRGRLGLRMASRGWRSTSKRRTWACQSNPLQRRSR